MCQLFMVTCDEGHYPLILITTDVHALPPSGNPIRIWGCLVRTWTEELAQPHSPSPGVGSGTRNYHTCTGSRFEAYRRQMLELTFY